MSSVRMLLAVLLFAVISQVEAGNTKLNPDNGVAIGIDLGTTYIRVGTFKNGRIEIIPNDHSRRVTPSYVAFTPEGERLIGDAAKAQASSNPQNTVFNVKRLIGRTWDDPALQEDIKYLPYMVVNRKGKPLVQVDLGGRRREFTPEEISAMLLIRMKQTAEVYLGQNVTAAVITVPAYFNNAQRQATMNAGKIAGLNILRIINEPTAAVLAYEVKKKSTHEEQNILVYDLGGGTFDVSIVNSGDGAIDVLSTSGNTHLGGEDFDQCIVEHLIKVIKKKTGHGINKNSRGLQKLRREAERAKWTLSSKYIASIEVENVVSGVDLSEQLSRAKFEELNKDLFQSTLVSIQTALHDSGLGKDDIDEVLFVGGSTEIPKIRQLVQDYFRWEQVRNRGVNVVGAVAYGAAVQASILNLEEDIPYDMTICDIVPMSLGIERNGGSMTVLIKHGTIVPYLRKETVWRSPPLKIFEGEHLLAELNLTGAVSGFQLFNVTFEVDVNGILNATAEYKVTAKDQPESLYWRAFKWVVGCFLIVLLSGWDQHHPREG